MAFLTQIASVLELGTTEAGTGSTFPIFKGMLPDSTVAGVPDRAVALLLTPGAPDDGHNLREHPGIQVLVRGAPLQNSTTESYEEAEGLAFTVKDALHGFSGESSSGARHIVGIWSQSGPFFGGYDSSMRPVFSNNLIVQRSKP